MYAAGPKNPLHGITLEMMLNQLVDHYGWEMLGRMIQINCFNFHPSIKSSLTFLRRTEWARKKVEELYIDSIPDMQPKPVEEPESETAPPIENEAPKEPSTPSE
ncbi:MAG: VF530 family DNA-binding protein [Verrucomicrobiota bacterium]